MSIERWSLTQRSSPSNAAARCPIVRPRRYRDCDGRAGPPPATRHTGIPDVVCNEQRSGLVDHDTDRSPVRLAAAVPQKAGEDIERHPIRASILERHEDHSVTAVLRAVPRAVLTNEHAVAERRGQRVAGVIGEPQIFRPALWVDSFISRVAFVISLRSPGSSSNANS